MPASDQGHGLVNRIPADEDGDVVTTQLFNLFEQGRSVRRFFNLDHREPYGNAAGGFDKLHQLLRLLGRSCDEHAYTRETFVLSPGHRDGRRTRECPWRRERADRLRPPHQAMPTDQPVRGSVRG